MSDNNYRARLIPQHAQAVGQAVPRVEEAVAVLPQPRRLAEVAEGPGQVLGQVIPVEVGVPVAAAAPHTPTTHQPKPRRGQGPTGKKAGHFNGQDARTPPTAEPRRGIAATASPWTSAKRKKTSKRSGRCWLIGAAPQTDAPAEKLQDAARKRKK